MRWGERSKVGTSCAKAMEAQTAGWRRCHAQLLALELWEPTEALTKAPLSAGGHGAVACPLAGCHVPRSGRIMPPGLRGKGTGKKAQEATLHPAALG